ncbi:MAG: zeta toxin family protein, partial [Terracoccus sp.]
HEDDTWYLDVPHVESDLSKAASLGHDNKQLGIYDLKRGETIESKDYDDAIGKQGRFEGRTDARYGSSQNDARADGGSYEEGTGENQERERSSRGLAWTAREKFARDLGRSDYSPDQERDHGRFSGNGSASSIKEAEARITGAGSSHVAVAPNTRPSFGLQNIASHMGNAYRGTDDGKKTQENWKGKASAFTSTQAAFKNGDKYDADRKEIHDKYVSDVNKDVPVSKEQTVWMTGGGPASGKTSGLLRNENATMPIRESDKEGTDRPHFPTAVFVSADEAKERIPEYQAGLKAKDPNAAGFVHDETSDMTKGALSKAIATRKDIVYDSTGDSGIDALTAKVNGMRAMGVKKVNASYATLDTDVAQKRSNIRGAQTGRFVPHDVLVANHKEVSKTMIQAMDRGLFDHQQIWDTSGRKPELVASSSREHGVSVVNPTLWSNLQKRAGLDK